jgi:hypothetical protein
VILLKFKDARAALTSETVPWKEIVSRPVGSSASKYVRVYEVEAVMPTVVCSLSLPLVPAETVARIVPPLPPETPGVKPLTSDTELHSFCKKSAGTVGKVRTKSAARLGTAPNIDATNASIAVNAILLFINDP